MALALAQDTPALLLDEPTTFLDIAAQIDLLDLAWKLNREEGRTIVVILHDLNMAARYADLIVALKDGEVVASGTPAEVMTGKIMRTVFGIEATITDDPLTGAPLVMPIQAAAVDELEAQIVS
jgi:iron complex transport system ATP-binding protein